jgi:curved DNA-binding protein CbpA
VVDKTDFVSFYQQLGLKPGCTLDELKGAYRRRVSELHPDRRGDEANPADAARLQELTAAYSAASVFHRRYGRLPGGHHVTARGPMPTAPVRNAPVAPARGSRKRALLWLALFGGLAWLVWNSTIGDSSGDAGADRPAAGTRAAAGDSISSSDTRAWPAQRIDIGVDEASVRALEGRPVAQNGEHWDYGPSWIEFSDGKVKDWYSSKLHPLKVATTRPLPPEPPTRPR